MEVIHDQELARINNKIQMFLLVHRLSSNELFFSNLKRTNVRRVFAIKHIKEIVGKYGAYLQLNYWEKESKSIKFNGMYLVLLNSLQTEGQHVDYLIELLKEV